MRWPDEPVYVPWPLTAAGKAYAAIDGKHLWTYVQEQVDISRCYRDQGHPQHWGRIVGTSGDVESARGLGEGFCGGLQTQAVKAGAKACSAM